LGQGLAILAAATFALWLLRLPFEKGESGNPGGRPEGKPFRDALMMEIAAAGDDHKALRKIAAAPLAKAGAGDVTAINGAC